MKRSLPLGSAIALGVALFASSASAQPRVVVLDWSGQGAARARNEAVRGLGDHAELVPADEVGAPSSGTEYAAAASEHGIQAFIEGSVRRAGRRFRATVTVRDATGEEVASESFQARSLNALGAQLRRQLWRSIRPAIEGSAGEADTGGSGDTGGGETTPAPSTGGPLIILPFRGPGADQAQRRVIGVIETAGVTTMGAPDGEIDDDDSRARAARRVGAAGIVQGEVAHSGSRYEVLVHLYAGEDGDETWSATYEGASANAMLAAVSADLWSELGPSVSALEAMPADEVDDDFDEDDESRRGGSDYVPPTTGPGLVPFSVFFDFALFHRQWSYNDDIFARLRAYSLPVGPTVALRVHWYPAAHFTTSFIGNIGFDLRGETAFGLKSTDSSGREYPTTMYGFSAGLRVRIPFADQHQIAAVVGYGEQTFRIDAIDPENPMPEVPDVDYQFLRLGAEGRFVFAPVSFEVKASYLFLTGTGPLAWDEWFPRSSGGGAEFGATVGFLLLDMLEVRASGEYRRYFFSMNPEVGDPMDRIAGGALDEYIMGSLGLAVYVE